LKSYLEQAFGRGDVTSARMQAAIREWLNLYYGTQSPGEDAADRLAVLVVSKLCRTVFAEYESRTAEALAPSLQALDAVRVQAMQYALVGGECLLKPVLHGRGFDFVPIRRDCYAPLGRDAHGALTGVGTMEVLRHDGRGYLLLERRTAGADGLTIETRLFELAGEALGVAGNAARHRPAAAKFAAAGGAGRWSGCTAHPATELCGWRPRRRGGICPCRRLDAQRRPAGIPDAAGV